MSNPIYLDYNATTPIDPRVLEAMMPYLQHQFGNPASTNHVYGWDSNKAVNKAREQAADLIKAKNDQIFWTSGATESNNLAIQSFFRPFIRQKIPAHLITTSIEHKAVLDVARSLENWGVEVTYLKPDKFGMIHPNQVIDSIRPNTKMISVIMAQNEIGTINPIEKIGEIAKSKDIRFHVDAAQSLGKISIDVERMNIDMLSSSGHKIYAPKGVGFLYLRSTENLEPICVGGKQEKCIRPGTHNVPSIVAMGEACEIASQEMQEESKRLSAWRDQFIEKVLNSSDKIALNGHPTERLYSNINFSFSETDPDCFDLHLGSLAISSGSACSTGEPSYILRELGHSYDLAKSSIRLGIGRFTQKSDLDTAAEAIIKMVGR